jgi:hypothetical protein
LTAASEPEKVIVALAVPLPVVKLRLLVVESVSSPWPTVSVTVWLSPSASLIES